ITPAITATDVVHIIIQGSISTSNPINCSIVDLGTFSIGSPSPIAQLAIATNPGGKTVSFQNVNVPGPGGCPGGNPVTTGTAATWLQISPNSITSPGTLPANCPGGAANPQGCVEVTIATGDQAIVPGAVLFGNVVVVTPNVGVNCANSLAGGFVGAINDVSSCFETITYKVTIAAQAQPVLQSTGNMVFDLVKGGGG